MQERPRDRDDIEQVTELFHDTTTARLLLRRPTPHDVDELFAMYSDRRVWVADRLLRHTAITQTQNAVERWTVSWRRHGLGSWVLRALDTASAGQLIGVGGCSLPTEVAWNLAFTLCPESWGRGYAQEVAAAGIRCARARRPELPITAVVAERNARSSRAVERAGLQMVWRGPDRKDPESTSAVLLYADRALSEEQMRALTA